MGLAPGANIGDGRAVFEAVQGSAPDIAGDNIANPTSVMLATAMLFDHLDDPDKANRIRQAVRSHETETGPRFQESWSGAS